ncbi:MAG TPA: TIGR03862 family flavoprotein, partial [Rhodopila sp.]|nr:TIGR03862 family flavoprotein [Rhodopila sp.]
GWVSCLPGLVAPFRPANCGFLVNWSAHFRERFAGRPLKRLAVSFRGETERGEAMISEGGIEGGVIYALAGRLRDAIAAEGQATISLDLRPDLSRAVLEERLGGPRRGESLANVLRKRAGLVPEAIGLVQEALHNGGSTAALPGLIKALPVRLVGTGALARAISSAGGIRAEALDESLMLVDYPGVFAAGEMLDWEAPTGGYLLQACLSQGAAAANGALAWLQRRG